MVEIEGKSIFYFNFFSCVSSAFSKKVYVHTCVDCIMLSAIKGITFFLFPCCRYRIEYEALSKVESEQNEFIDQFILQKWGCNQDRENVCDHIPRVPVLFSLAIDVPARELLCCNSFSEAIPKLQHHPNTSTSRRYIFFQTVCEATASCLLWLFLPWSAGVTINSDVSLNIFGTRGSVHTKYLIISVQHQRRWSYLYKGILFILFILKNYSVYLVLLLFVSIEILHVHASVNTFDFSRKHFDIWIWSCVIFALIPFFWYNQCVGRPHKEYILFFFKYISYFCYVKHCPSCINLDDIRLYLNKYYIKLYDKMCHLCCQYSD